MFTDVSTNSLAGYNDVGFNWTKAHAVVMIINAATGEILNAGKTALTSINIVDSWNCDPVNGCVDPGTGIGNYSALATCNAACNTNSIEESNTFSFNLYPNPVKDRLVIKGEYTSANIYDVYGKLVLTTDYRNTINVTDLINGVYFINITKGDEDFMQKITISK
jgi:hypothetical protein